MSSSPGERKAEHLPNATVAECARECFESFQNCLNNSSESDNLSGPSGPRLSLVRVEDQLARFQLWTANIRVFSSSRDSLDYRLRDAPEVQTAVIGLLQALSYRIKTCSRILDSGILPSSKPPAESVADNFDGALDGLSKEITLLHKITNTIRRASKDTQNSRAAERFRITDEEDNEVAPCLHELFVNYIRDKFPGINDEIRQRLADSMLLRRKRILYRRERYGKTPIRLPKKAPGPAIVHPEPETTAPLKEAERPAKRRIVAVPRQSVVHSVAQTSTTLSPESFKKAAAPSVISISKTVALGSSNELSFPPAPSNAFIRRYNEAKRDIEDRFKQGLLAIVEYDELVYPHPSEFEVRQKITVAENVRDEAIHEAWDSCMESVGEVTCPYCFHALPIREVVDDTKWKYHVKNDLDPYVCLFENCHIPGHMYTHSSTWIKHMSEHALRWRCKSKAHDDFVAESRDEYVDHMKNCHAGKFTEAQLGILADRNGRTTGPLFKVCPLCGIEKTDVPMVDHVVGHMRSLALKSLPIHHEDADDSDETSMQQDSLGSFRPHSRSTIKNELEVSLTFSHDSPHSSLRELPDGIPSVSRQEYDQSLDQWMEAVAPLAGPSTLESNNNLGLFQDEQPDDSPLKIQFACPFHQHDPKRYATKRSCCGPGFKDIHRLKEHLFRIHRLPEHQCHRCFTRYMTQEDLRNHQRADEPCQIQEPGIREEEGINESQEAQLRVRARRKAKHSEREYDVARWTEIYRILFPNDDQVPSAYYK